MTQEEFLLVAHAVTLEMDTTPFAAQSTFVPFGEGIENIAEALNEVVQQYFFFSQHGYAQNYVTGMAPAYTCTGRRIIGDPAQDYIFNQARKFGLMTERNTNIQLSVPQADGSVDQITCPVTIANVTDLGGATTDGSAVSFEIRFNGKPTLTNISPEETLTVQSVAGTAVGTTTITTTPETASAGCKFVWAYGSVAPTATVGQVLTGWNDFTSGEDYTVPTGNNIVVAMVNLATNVVVSTGQTTATINGGD